MNVAEAMNYIEEKNQLGSVLGLENIKELLFRLGNPQNQCKVVHIAGTNGKGSILAFIDAVLQNAGYGVGRYISPTVFSYFERFQINGNYIAETAFAAYLSRIRAVVEEMEADGIQGVTAFEIETALAFLYFLDEQVDVVLLETGMGGRLDATNVVARPICTILASISLDHTKILGDTIEAIAYEKTGILREDVPCVVYPINEAAMPVIEEQCSLHNAELIAPDLDELVIKRQDLTQELFDYKNVEYSIGLLGEHQVYNAITAVETLMVIDKFLKSTGEDGLEKVNIANGLHNAKWKGRFEILERNPYVIRDGAHNPDAAKQLYQLMTKHFTNHRIIYIIGVLGDKDHQAILSLLVPLAWKVYVVTVPDNPRALPAKKLAEEVNAYCNQVEIAASPKQAYERAKAEATSEDVILAFGSLYYIGRIGDR